MTVTQESIVMLLWESGGPDDDNCVITPAHCRFRPCTAVQGVWCCRECEYFKTCKDRSACPIASAQDRRD